MLTIRLLQQRPIFGDMGDWYTAVYSLTIVIFGLRRIAVKPTGYIKRQTFTLMSVQVIPLFILPMFVFPFLGTHGLLGDWVMKNVFPDGSYWRAFGFVLAWPLFIHNLATGQPTMFWLLRRDFAIVCDYSLYCLSMGQRAPIADGSAPAAPWPKPSEMNTGPTRRMELLRRNWKMPVSRSLVCDALSRSLRFFPGKRDPRFRLRSDIYGVVVDIVFAGSWAWAFIFLCPAGYGAVFFAHWRP